MKALQIVLSFIVILILFGCPTRTTPPTVSPEVSQLEGDWTHEASGMVFPQSIGDFKRVTINHYDKEENNVGVGYNLQSMFKPVIATVYVYPSPRIISIMSPPEVIETTRTTLSKNQYEATKQGILSGHENARLKEYDFNLPQGEMEVSGKLAVFEYDGVFASRQQKLMSILYFFTYVNQKWTVKYRFTFPRVVNASKEVKGFMKDFSWSIEKSEKK